MTLAKFCWVYQEIDIPFSSHHLFISFLKFSVPFMAYVPYRGLVPISVDEIRLPVRLESSQYMSEFLIIISDDVGTSVPNQIISFLFSYSLESVTTFINTPSLLSVILFKLLIISSFVLFCTEIFNSNLFVVSKGNCCCSTVAY